MGSNVWKKFPNNIGFFSESVPYDDDTDENDSDNDNSEDSPRDHDLPPTCSIAFLAGPAGDEMVIF